MNAYSANLTYDDAEEELRASVRAATERYAPTRASADLYDRPAAGSPIWTVLTTELGLGGLLVPESLGGFGCYAREAAVVLEVLGGSVAPAPFLTSAVAATLCLVGAGDSQQLPHLAAGTRTAALCVPLTAYGPVAPTVRIGASGGLTGAVTSVPGAQDADALIVPVRDGADLRLYDVAADAPGLTRTAVTSLDMTRPLIDVDLADVPGRLLCTGERAGRAVDAALVAAAALLASEQVGLAERCVRSTVAHLRNRVQFGRPLGSFQALKHRLAELHADVLTARAVARYAADCLATDAPDLPVAASLAQAHCADLAVRAAEECVQLHGGTGMTWEHPAHLYLKRAKADQLAFGTPARHRQEIAALADVPAPLAAG